MMPVLIPPSEMPAIPGVRMPQEFYWVLQSPAPLAGMSYPPLSTPWSAIAAAGLRCIVCLAEETPHYDPTPLKITYAAKLEDLAHKCPPKNPSREGRLIREAVLAAEGKVRSGEGVVIHCDGGTGRTGTVIGCLLRALGLSASEAVAYLDVLNKARGRKWPEAIWQAQLVER